MFAFCRALPAVPRAEVDLKKPGVRYNLASAGTATERCPSPGLIPQFTRRFVPSARAGSVTRFSCPGLALLVLGLGLLVGPEGARAQRPLGIDVSQYRGVIDWSSVASSGITFAWARATSNTFFTDTKFTANESGATNAHVLIGAYHDACYNVNLGTAGAIQEANFFWSVASNYIKGGGVCMMPMLDVEATPSGYNTQSVLSQWINQWCTSISNYAAAASCPGVKPLIYVSAANTSWFDSSVAQWTAWIADHTCGNPQTTDPTYPFGVWPTWTFWQYCSTNSVPGVPPPTDQDVFNGTAAGLPAYVIAGVPPYLPSQPASQTVLAGANVTFTVGASGAAPISYQWRLNGANISGATASQFTTNNVQLASAGSYSVVVTGPYGPINSANAVLTVHTPPVITAQPTNVTAGLGLGAAFSVSATGTSPLSYQWRRNGGSLTGATTSVLTFASVQATNAGTYSVVVTNLYGTATSSNAWLTVLDPYITSQPQNQTLVPGGNAVFSVSAAGTAPLGYRWCKEGAPLVDGGRISGAATATLTVATAQVGDMGNYSVVVSNVSGQVVSSNATLLGPFPPLLLTQPASQTVSGSSVVSFTVGAVGPGLSFHWQRASTNLADGGEFSGSATASLTVSNVQAGDMGGYSVIASNTYGSVTSSIAALSVWPLLGWGQDDYYEADIPDGLTNVTGLAAGRYHSLALRADGTVAAWGAGTTGSGTGSDYGQAVVPAGLSNVVGIAGGAYHSLALQADGRVAAWGAGATNTGASPNYGQAAVPGGLTNAVAVAAGYYHSLALTAAGTVLGWGYNLYGQTNSPAGLTNAVAVASGAYHGLALQADGTVVAWGAGTNYSGVSPNYGQALVPTGLTGVVAVAAGGYHSLALKADGTVVAWGAGMNNTGSNPNYGQAMVPVGLTQVVAIACGFYHSLALKADGTVVSWGAGKTSTGTTPNYGQALVPAGLTNGIVVAGGGYHTLLLEGDGRPRLTTQPFGQVAAAGTTVTLAALAVGGQPLTYQWQCDGTNVAGATSDTLTLAALQYSDTGAYTLVVSNSIGTAVSAPALVSVQSPPVLNVQPFAQTVVAGTPISFSVAAMGNPPFSYQWRLNGSNIAGATLTSYGLAGAQPADAGGYSVLVTNAFGAAASSNATLTVLVVPSIVTPPTNQTVNAGTDVSFSVVAAGSAPLGYQWVFNASKPLAGATDDTLLLTNVQPVQGGSYTVVITNAAGSITSAVASLTVLVPVTISSVSLAGPQISVAFPSQSGLNYVLEYKNALADPAWTPLAPALMATGSVMVLQDTNAPVASRYYRVHSE